MTLQFFFQNWEEQIHIYLESCRHSCGVARHKASAHVRLRNFALYMRTDGFRLHAQIIYNHCGDAQNWCLAAECLPSVGATGCVWQTLLRNYFTWMEAPLWCCDANDAAAQVAIKKVLQDKRFKNRELQIMKVLGHTNVVQLKHCFYSTNEKMEVFLNLVLEFVPETVRFPLSFLCPMWFSFILC